MWDTPAVVFRSDPKASSQITPALKRVVLSNYSAPAREGGRGRDDRKAVRRLGDVATLEEFVPVLGGTGSATADASKRLRRWLCRKHKVKTGKYVRYPDERLWQSMGLTRLKRRTASFAWAKGMISNESRVREIRTLGSMSGERKRGQGGD